MKKSLLFLFMFLLTGATILAQYKNIEIHASNNPEEPSIIIDPKNPARLVAGANLNNYYYSSDTGKTWSKGFLSSPYGVWGDPAISVDTNGHFYFFHLSNPVPGNGSFIDRIVVQKSTTQGSTWNTGTFMGLNGTKQQDKQWAAIDRRNNAIYVTWTEFDRYGSSAPTDSSRIMFSRSTDGGNTWSTQKRINKKSGDCIDGDNTVEGAVPAVGPNGEIYVTWAGPDGLVFNKSLDGGNTWLAADKIITPIPGGWDFDVPGIYRANGLPITLCDVSNGPNKGTIYVNWSDQRNGITDTDIWMTKSTDGGNTWSALKKINDDTKASQQFFTWMTIDQANGNLYTAFYDRRNYTDLQTDVYMAYSTDGGNTFTNERISETPFVPVSTVFFGDYLNITAHNNIVRPIWARMDVNGVSRVFTALINNPVANAGNNGGNVLHQNYPNPTSNLTFIAFKLHNAQNVSIYIYDMSGKLLATPLKNAFMPEGRNVIPIDSKKLFLAAGTYIYTLQTETEKISRKLIIQ